MTNDTMTNDQPMRSEIEKTLLNKICDQVSVKSMVNNWQTEGKKVVFTNGVFDLLHIGHITYLAKAAEAGDKLIIGLNSDSSVKRLKGENRPVNDQNNRAALLASLFFVDAVVVFEEDTPLNLITALMPDILIKGADYAVENIVGAKEVIANGGQVKTISFVEGYSSTKIIEKIRNQIA
jgi:rfaE bifunctional protein nucleotidyltransferase chain/domain